MALNFTKPIVVAALLGYLNPTQAQSQFDGSVCYPTQQVWSQCNAQERSLITQGREDLKDLIEFRYFVHSSEHVKTLFNDWYEENKDDSDDGVATGSDNDSDSEGGQMDDDSHLPVLSTSDIKSSDQYNSCDGAVRRLNDEGQKRILVPQGAQYEDVSFPAKGHSIDRNKNDDEQGLKWKRITQIDSGATSTETGEDGLWGQHDVRPAAIRQGSLGDCWLLAAIAAIGEFPERVKTFFSNQPGYSANGQFVLKLWANGQTHRVHIDDQIPMRSATSNSPMFTKESRNGAWWGPLAEKAAAKYYGDYQTLTAGQTDAAVSIFTGHSTYTYEMKDQTPDAIWDKINSYDELNYMMTSGIGNIPETHGLIRNHAYTVLGTAMLNNQKIYKMRNPWGTERYTGDLDDGKLTDAQKTALGNPVAGDGKFFMTKEEFATVFKRGVGVTDYRDWNHQSRFETEWVRNESFRLPKYEYKITNPTQQDVQIGFAGYQERMYQCDDDSSSKGDMLLFRLYKVEGTRLIQQIDKFDESYKWLNYWQSNGAFMMDNLPAGEYVLKSTQNAYTSKNTGSLPFSIYGYSMTDEMTISERNE